MDHMKIINKEVKQMEEEWTKSLPYSKINKPDEVGFTFESNCPRCHAKQRFFSEHAMMNNKCIECGTIFR